MRAPQFERNGMKDQLGSDTDTPQAGPTMDIMALCEALDEAPESARCVLVVTSRNYTEVFWGPDEAGPWIKLRRFLANGSIE